ncbi:hypothetical protein V6V47_29365 [Micromonospora sp. CPCC 205539]|uniref:hypothetical protein n=1 Tax=Micromonospora sp. CPCC 205539 TaxID=3122408 RepID=UPI002FF14DDC
MIPTMILFGLAFGHWWRSTLVAAALIWPALMLASQVTTVEIGLLGAAGLGVANAAVGVLVHQTISRAIRGVRRPDPSPGGNCR